MNVFLSMLNLGTIVIPSIGLPQAFCGVWYHSVVEPERQIKSYHVKIAENWVQFSQDITSWKQIFGILRILYVSVIPESTD